jgi:hypothetical protein
MGIGMSLKKVTTATLEAWQAVTRQDWVASALVERELMLRTLTDEHLLRLRTHFQAEQLPGPFSIVDEELTMRSLDSTRRLKEEPEAPVLGEPQQKQRCGYPALRYMSLLLQEI